MTARNKYLIVGLVAFFLATAWAGRSTAQSVYVNYYTPQFYMDYLVFYDETGAPIYYEDDNAYAVPSDYPEYNELVNHFLDNEDAYFRWFEEVGYANLQFRRTPIADYYKPRYYHGYVVFYEGGQPVYYIDGARHVIPRSDRRYARLVRHYNKSRADYDRWYRSTGRHYRWYIRPVYTDYYRPMYYNGYLVFFDASGIPFYYRGGQVVYVPRSHRDYNGYVSHYRSHRHNYDRWYKDRGRRHHEYRQPKSHRKRVIAPKAPRATHGRAENRKYRPTIRPQRRPTIQPAPHQPPPPVEPKRHDYRDRPGRPDHAPPPPVRPDRAPPPPVRPDRSTHPVHVAPPGRPDRPGHPDKPKPMPPGQREKEKKEKEKKEKKEKEEKKPPRPIKPPRR